MPRPETARVSLYRLQPTDDLASLVDERYFDGGYEPRAVRVGGRPALLIIGSRTLPAARWCAPLGRMVGQSVVRRSVTPSAVLLINLGAEANFALTFGPDGLRMLRGGFVERDFGLRIAVRVLEPDKIRKLTRLALDSTARIDRSSVPSGQNIRGFGVEEYAELINRVTGRTKGLEITYTRGRDVSLSLEGADGLKTRLSVNGGELVGDLRTLLNVLDQPALEGLEFIEKIRRLVGRDPRIPILNDRLGDVLQSGSGGALGLALPDEYIDEADDVQSYRVTLGGDNWVVDEVSLEPILEGLRKSGMGDLLATLKKGRIVGCAESDGTHQSGGSYTLDKWLAAEIVEGTSRFIFQQGDWFEISDDAYITFLDERVDEALANHPNWSLPPWAEGVHERDYNDEVVGKLPDFVALDRKLIKSTTHPGFEACDVLGPDNELIHVKRAESSAPLSHLFNQGLVSADILCTDMTAMHALRKKVEAVAGASRAAALPDRPATVVFAIQMPKAALTTASLFTFSKISLHRARLHIESRLGVPVKVIDIPR